jgi:hypothetical protein
MKVKALFLLFVFLLNSAVGLNCALQKDDDCCKEVSGYHPDLSIQLQQDRKHPTLVTEEDPCCQNAVNNFAALAKLVPQPLKVLMPAPVAIVRSVYVYAFASAPVIETAHQSRIDERQRPPTTDIRIVIRSFQI